MNKIAFLGLGAMGSRMAVNLLKAGYDLRVWNRSSECAIPLETEGAKVFESPRKAVQGADFVFSMVRDDSASRYVWCDESTGALMGMKEGAIAIECSTLSPGWVKQLHRQMSESQVTLLDAPVAGSRPQAEAGQLIFLVGGNEASINLVRPVLETMGSAIHHAGPSGAGATIKLAINVLFGVQIAAMAELLGFLKASKLDVNHAVDIVKSTPVCSPAVGVASTAMLSGKFDPMFPIELVKKDFKYAVNRSGECGVTTPLSGVTLSVFQQAIDSGFGEDNITGVAQLYI